jgi:uncharacterized protein
MPYKRLLEIDLESKSSILLLGPRGTGKTHWIKAHFPNALYFDLLHTETYNDLQSNPSRLENKIPKDFSDWIILDEIQKIPELLNEVHRLIEHYKYRFVLTGSSARKLRRSGVNLLAGRALSYYMHPLTAIEVGEKFSITKALNFGLLPAAVDAKDPAHYLQTYITTYLREEVLQEGLVRNLGEFARFLEHASYSQGNLLNVSEVAREAMIKRKTVETYFNIVEDLLIACRINAFTKRAKRRLVSHPKFYFFDTGVYRTLRPKGPLDTSDRLDGAALETLFLQHIKAINDYYRLGYQFYFWRTSNQVEVDFVAYGEQGLHAFEIKRKSKINRSDASGLLAFQKDYPEAKLYLLYGGDKEEHIGDIKILPIVYALKNIKEILAA